ncbi:MAG TPA: DUF3991 and toprim domain-containing protein [Clostridia bacterium]|nr:DUF3991 and toprim domain-containing protein [Clostridia bacterium]
MRQSYNNGVTPEQIAEAKKLDLFSYLSLYEPNELVHVAGNEYCTRTHDSLKISNGLWRWCSRDIAGRTALDYLIKVRGISFVDAVKQLCSFSVPLPERTATNKSATKPQERAPFFLPAANFTNNVVIDYLCNKRGLPQEVVASCIKRKLIYEAKEHHNAVFVGYDKSGLPRFATLRGCYEKPFKKDVEGSNKAIGFSLPARSPQADIVCVFESAIDAISFGVLHQKGDCSHLLSLGGVAPLALERYLSDYPQIKQVVLGLDNDAQGRKASAKIAALLEGRGYEVHDMPPQLGKDYNEELLARRALKRDREQCR